MKFLQVFIFCSLSIFSIAQKGESVFIEYDFSKLDKSTLFSMEKFHGCIYAQSTAGKTTYEFKAQNIGHIHAEPFIAFSAKWEDEDNLDASTLIGISFSKDNKTWTKKNYLSSDWHFEGIKGVHVSELMYIDKNYKYYKLTVLTNAPGIGNQIKNLKLNFFNPYGESNSKAIGTTPVNSGWTNTASANNSNLPLPSLYYDANHSSMARDVNACPCTLPNFITRPQWNCPQGAGLVSGVGTSAAVSHLIVHHSAGNNTATDWNAVVLSIWNYHTGTNGYSDIGYNWLIAPNGQLYEGRGSNSLTQNVTGAHFCGTNAGTMGVCMIGTYTNVDITSDARNTLTKLLAWKCCQAGIPPVGTALHASSGLTLNRISGHRDGCSTECPGNALYPTLPALRTAVQNSIDTCGNAAPCLPSVKLQISGCPSSNLTFTPINVTNGGTAPTFTWFLNNVQVATGATYTNVSASNGDKVHATMTSNASCANPTQVNSDTLTVTCITTTAIAQIEGVELINISPNPTSNGQTTLTMKLRTPKQVQLRIVDANGATIWYGNKETWSGTTQRTITVLSTNTQGIYFIEVTVNGKKATYRLVGY
jgi:hypothetical protein